MRIRAGNTCLGSVFDERKMLDLWLIVVLRRVVFDVLNNACCKSD